MIKNTWFKYKIRNFPQRSFGGLFWAGIFLISSGILSLVFPFILIGFAAALLVGAGTILLWAARFADEAMRVEIFDRYL